MVTLAVLAFRPPCFSSPRTQAPRADDYGAVEPPSYVGRQPDRFWTWQGYRVRYQHHVARGQARGTVLLIHGFGGNAEHWRKNAPVLSAEGYDVYAVDLLGYGFSAKPDPRITAPLRVDPTMPQRFYNIPMWAAQCHAFLREVCDAQPISKLDQKSGAFVITNSVGGSVGLQLALEAPDLVRAVALLDPSIRMLHASKQMPWERPFVPIIQWALRETQLGEFFYNIVATPSTVQSILRVIYPANPEAVDEELVDCILKPGLSSANATRVFMDFISYSAGPLPEEQLEQLGRSSNNPRVWIGWGSKDPWEPIDKGRQLYADLAAVTRFQELPGLGHCPMDESPKVVNPFLLEFLEAFR